MLVSEQNPSTNCKSFLLCNQFKEIKTVRLNYSENHKLFLLQVNEI